MERIGAVRREGGQVGAAKQRQLVDIRQEPREQSRGWDGHDPTHSHHQLAVALMDLALTYVPAMYHLVNGRSRFIPQDTRGLQSCGPAPLHLSNFFLIGILGRLPGSGTGKLTN